jgi:hypothetical protein
MHHTYRISSLIYTPFSRHTTRMQLCELGKNQLASLVQVTGESLTPITETDQLGFARICSGVN